MKKIFPVLVVFVFCLPVIGLSQKAKVGFSGGLTVANMTGTVGGVKESGKTKSGYSAGLFMDATIKKHFSFQGAVEYVQKGEVLSKTQKQKVYRALHYVEMPLNFLYNSWGNGGNFFVGLGPTLSVGVPSSKVTKPIPGEKVFTDIVFGNTGVEDFKGVDFGVNFLGGYRLKSGIGFNVNYTQGIRNLIPKGKATGSLRNNFFGIGLSALIPDNNNASNKHNKGKGKGKGKK